MAKPIVKTATVTGDTDPFVFDPHVTPFAATLQIKIAGGTANVTVFTTLDDPNLFANKALFLSSAAWIAHPFLTGVTANANGNIAYPITAAKVTVNSIAGATVTATALQAGLV